MKIPVVGFDPSMTGWGIAESELDLTTGYLDTPLLRVLEPKKITSKQVRQNSVDLDVAEKLSKEVFAAARRAKVVFAEVPVGSQSARAMCAYGVCVGILGALRAEGIQIIEVTATEVKLALTGDDQATKKAMIAQAVALYPTANFPRQAKNGKGFRKGDLTAKAEHVADAIGAIHAGVLTPMFQNLLRLYQPHQPGELRADHAHPGRDRDRTPELRP
jgi:Holliday junction resolvasome RuvABC endonuclease subunit